MLFVNSQRQHIILVCSCGLLVLLLGPGHEPKENKKEKIFWIPKVKNCKGISSLHRFKNTACFETPLFTVIYVGLDYLCGYKCLPISRSSQFNQSLNFIKF